MHIDTCMLEQKRDIIIKLKLGEITRDYGSLLLYKYIYTIYYIVVVEGT